MSIVATGGEEILAVGSVYRKFSEDGTLTVTTGGTVDILIVGGGGGGGAANYGTRPGGGGGAGAVRVLTNYRIAAGSYPVTIGRGGAGGATGPIVTQITYPAENGGVTTITGIGTAGGGGAGANQSEAPGVSQVGQNGSSGGGGCGTVSGGVAGYPVGQGPGFRGGAGRTDDPRNSGGGGGAGGPGDSALDVAEAQGGAGIQVPMFAVFGDGGWFGSGGGGGRRGAGSTHFPSRPGGGGYGSGGAGFEHEHGQHGTGGGGGGARSQHLGLAYPGGDGGDGIVIVRYAADVVVPVEEEDIRHQVRLNFSGVALKGYAPKHSLESKSGPEHVVLENPLNVEGPNGLTIGVREWIVDANGMYVGAVLWVKSFEASPQFSESSGSLVVEVLK